LIFFFTPRRTHEEGESPETERGGGSLTPTTKQSPSLLTRELQGEGVGVRAVDERKGVEVHHTENDDDTP
jgi:hypothetical protein